MKRIAHITDLHLDESFPIDHGVRAKENWKKILDDVVSRGVKEVVFTGDIGSKESNAWFFESIKNYPVNLKLTIGNHDLFSETIKFYNPGLPQERNELYYTDEDEYFKYIFMDSSTSKITIVQFNWLEDEMKTDKRIILFIHHPVLETSTPPQRDYPLDGSKELKEILLTHQNEVNIFCGHLHMKHERCEGSINQYITPAACYQIKKQSENPELENIDFGYRILEIGKDRIKSKVIMFTT